MDHPLVTMKGSKECLVCKIEPPPDKEHEPFTLHGENATLVESEQGSYGFDKDGPRYYFEARMGALKGYDWRALARRMRLGKFGAKLGSTGAKLESTAVGRQKEERLVDKHRRAAEQHGLFITEYKGDAK